MLTCLIASMATFGWIGRMRRRFAGLLREGHDNRLPLLLWLMDNARA